MQRIIEVYMFQIVFELIKTTGEVFINKL